MKVALDCFRDIKEDSYNIIKKSHSLRRGKRIEKIFLKKMDGELVYKKSLVHLKTTLNDFFSENYQDPQIWKKINKYNQGLDNLIAAIDESFRHKTPLKIGIIAVCLRGHTNLFKVLSGYPRSKVQVSGGEWRKCYLLFINQWGNNI